MKQRIVRIGSQDRQWHERFFRHAGEAFEGIDFSRWESLGGWREAYTVLAVVEDGEILATTGVSRMMFSTPGKEDTGPRRLFPGLQLGAVATRADRRFEGHAANLLQHILAEAGDRPVLLFANPSVTGFYPKFGFVPLDTQAPYALIDIRPAAGAVRRFDETAASDRRLLNELSLLSVGHGGALSARADPSILLWYLANGFAEAQVLFEERSIAFVRRESDRLVLLDWIGLSPPELSSGLALLADQPVGRVDFGFVPDPTWLSEPVRTESALEVLMFWRGHSLAQQTLCFPQLLMT